MSVESGSGKTNMANQESGVGLNAFHSGAARIKPAHRAAASPLPPPSSLIPDG